MPPSKLVILLTIPFNKFPGTDEKVQESTQDPVEIVSKQIAAAESNEMKTEVKEEVKTERFEDFEVHEQFGIDYITSKNLNDPFIKSETSRMKTEFKAEVKEETFQEFEAHEQVGIDLITCKDFDPPFIKSETCRIKTELKAEVKEEAFEEFDTDEQIGMDFITSQCFDTFSNKSDVFSINKEVKFDNQIKKEIKEEIKFETGVQRGLEILEKLELPIENKISQETNESQEANSGFENIREKEDLQLSQMKTEVKEKSIEDFEQIGIDIITNKDFGYA